MLEGFIVKEAIKSTGAQRDDPVVSQVWPVVNGVYRVLLSVLMVLLVYSVMINMVRRSETWI